MSRRLEAPDRKAKALSKRLASHSFDNEQGDEYEASSFGGFKDYFARKRIKLQNRDAHLRSTSAPAPALFAGLVLTVNGYTIPSLYTLSKLIVTHGGSFLQYMDGKTQVTHIIASNLTPKKKIEFARYKVVKPEWITESIAQGVLLPWSEYRLIDSTPSQRRLELATPGSTRGAVAFITNDNGGLGIRNVGRPSGIKTVVGAVGSSGVRKVVDLPPSTLSRDITIPPSDEPGSDEDEFPSYQTPVNNHMSFTAVPSGQPRRSFKVEDEEDDSLPPPSHQRDPPHYEEHPLEKIIADSDEDPEVFFSPVNLVSFPPFVSDSKDKPAPPQSFQFPQSSPLASTFQKPPPKKLTQAPPHPGPAIEEGEKEVLYEPECIVGECKYRNKRKPKYRRGWTQFLIHWAGFAYHEATWEFEKDLRADLGAEGLKEMVNEWREKPQRNVAGAEVYREVPKEELLAGKFFTRRELDEAFEEVVQSSPGEVIVVRQVMHEVRAETVTQERSPIDDRHRTDSPAPQDQREKEVPGTMDSEEHILPDEVTREVITDQSSPVRGVGGSGQEIAPISGQCFESIYGTPVDFPGDYEERIVEVGPNITETPKSVVKGIRADFPGFEEVFGEDPRFTQPLKSIVEGGIPVVLPKDYEDIFGGDLSITPTQRSTVDDAIPTVATPPPADVPVDRMEVDNQGVGLTVDVDILDDASMSSMDLLTPLEALEQYEELDISEEPFEAPKSPKKPLEQPKPSSKDQSEMTAEERNATYLADPAIRAQTVLNPNFLKNYFQESRLHHLSAWKAKIRSEIQASSHHLNPKKNRPRRYILHVDFDCFFASVSTRDRPDLAGKPVAIAHGGNSDNSKSSEIAACNYAARGFGVKNGMWMAEAKKLCPGLICLGYEYPRYEEASKVFYGVILAVGAERIQAASVDEALLDISNLCCDVGLETEQQEEEMAENIATLIRDRCREKTGGLEVSVGIGGNVLLAKLAMRKAKPAGQYLLARTQVVEFLNDVKVRELPGIGSNIASKVEESLGTNKVGEIKEVSRERLKNVLGEKTGEKLWGYCRGVDHMVVGEMSVRKSISADINWGVRFESQEQAELFVIQIAEEVENRMKAEGVKGKHLTLKVNKRAAHAPFMTRKFLGTGECDTTTKSILLGVATTNKDIMGKEAVTMLRSCRISPGELRGLGLTVTRLEEVQAGKADSGQKTLNFQKGPVKKDVAERKKLEEVVAKGENVPPDRPLPKAYVPPKVVTLMDKWNKLKAPKEKPPLTQVQQESKLKCTQFEIPDGVDLEVLQFYPSPIREQALRKMKEKDIQGQKKIQDELSLQDPPSQSPPPDLVVDLSFWRALPPEFRAEMREDAERLRREKEREKEREREREKTLASPSKRKSLLRQSPRKKRLPWIPGTATPPASPQKGNSLPFGQSPGTPTKRRRGRPPVSEAGPSGANVNPDAVFDAKGNDISSWFFEESGVNRSIFELIDEQSRQEFIAETVKSREIRLEEIRHQERKEAAERERLASAVRLPAPNRQTTLSAGRPVRTIKQIKDALEDWHEACTEGPHESDTEEFVEFLKRLVLVENSMPKADEAVRFFMNVVGHEESDWWDVVEKLARGVNDALNEMGLGPIDFGLEHDFYGF